MQNMRVQPQKFQKHQGRVAATLHSPSAEADAISEVKGAVLFTGSALVCCELEIPLSVYHRHYNKTGFVFMLPLLFSLII